MKYIKYFLQFLIVIICFVIFKILGPNLSSNLSGKLFKIIGPIFRSKKVIETNIKRAFPHIKSDDLQKIKEEMWVNYGKIFAEFMFMKSFRYGRLSQKIEMVGEEILDEIKLSKMQVVFISGHLSNFELMAMQLEKSGIKVSAIYRPLNNVFLNGFMESIRKKYICKNQIKKGIGGLKKLIYLKKNKFSTALMLDQRVSEGILSKFFNDNALTTTIPAQLVKKYNIPVVPVNIERIQGINFRITISKPISFSKDNSIQHITDELNKTIEEMIKNKPGDWIWSHNRWK
tara:strand:- start:1359 stop:2219 length:861 start_codon:yes stop_codon:yes gene_type:complete